MTWELGIAANAVVAAAYAAIAWSVLRGLGRSGELRRNRLGTATGLIFASCSFGHAGHLLHLIGLPGVTGQVESAAARVSYDIHLAVFDLVTGVIAITFFALKVRNDEGASERAVLYDDPATARRQALLVHEEVVQGLVVACYQLDDDNTAGARRTLSATLEQARSIASSPFAASITLEPGEAARR